MNKPAIINWIYIHLIDNHPTPLLTPYTWLTSPFTATRQIPVCIQYKFTIFKRYFFDK